MNVSWQQLMPREKLQQMGAGALTDAELLAIFLRTGSVGQDVMALAGQLLLQFGSLYRRDGEWRFQAVGAGFKLNLATFIRKLGGTV